MGTIPSSGVWVIVLVNSSNAKNADGYLLANIAAGSSLVTRPLLLTTTVSSLTTASSPTPAVSDQAPGIAGFPIISIVIGVVIGLLGTVLLRRRK